MEKGERKVVRLGRERNGGKGNEWSVRKSEWVQGEKKARPEHAH